MRSYLKQIDGKGLRGATDSVQDIEVDVKLER